MSIGTSGPYRPVSPDRLASLIGTLIRIAYTIGCYDITAKMDANTQIRHMLTYSKIVSADIKECRIQRCRMRTLIHNGGRRISIYI